MSDEMKRDGAMRIFEALSSVDEELLERSEGKKKVVPFWRYSKVLAACICLVVLGAATFATTRIASDNESSNDCAAPMEEMAAAPDMMAMEAETDMECAVAEEEAGVEYELTQGAAEDAEADAPAAVEDLENSKNESNTSQSDGMIMDWGPIENAPIRSDEETLRATEMFGDYVPTAIPAGYVFSDGCKYQDNGEVIGINLNWHQGLDYVMISVGKYDEEEDSARIVDVSNPETYNVHLYDIPYADSVPDEVRTTFNTPIFKESDFSIEVIEARMKSVEDAGDTDTPRGNFEVLYDSGILVSFTGRGSAQEIWEMFESIKGE